MEYESSDSEISDCLSDSESVSTTSRDFPRLGSEIRECLVDEESSSDETFENPVKKRTFKCAHCDAKFTRKKNRNTHQLGHTSKNFQCEKCDKKFQYPR